MAHKTTILLALVALWAAALLPADDGGSFYPEDWTFGNIYVTEPNDKIALKNELMLCRLPNVTAVFDFQNTTAETVTVPCAFPVVVEMPFSITKKDGAAVSAYINQGAEPNYDLWALVLNKKIESSGYWIKLPLTPDELNALDKKLRTISYEDYKKQTGSSNRCVRCEITLDGKSVPITAVGIETTVVYTPEEDSEYYGKRGHIQLVLHFAHELTFAPRKSAVLNVSYDCDVENRARRSVFDYGFVYDISTGGTWKGSMDSFIIAVQADMEMAVRGAKDGFTRESNPYCSFFYREAYKPEKEERFSFSLEKYEDERWGQLHSKEKDDFVTGIKASSFLKGTYSHADSDVSPAFYTESPAMKKSGYGPETSFDGDPLNGWVEGAAGDGIGEYIEFTLQKPAIGPFATNGLSRYYVDKNTPELPFDSWRKNGRVKRLNVQKADGTLYSHLDLLDKYSGDSASFMDANAVLNPTLMDKGTWRLEIADVYKGTKFDDTVLGEVWFYPLSDSLYRIISRNDSSENPIYRRGIESFLKSTETTPAEFEKKHQKLLESLDAWWWK